MFEAIEQFATKYQHTAELITAIATAGAVIVSLWLARRATKANQTQLQAAATMRFIIHDTVDRNNPPTYLVVSITNLGNMPLRIPFSFFFWKVPLKRGVMLVTPLDFSGDRWISRKQYPVEIAPRASESFYLSDEPTMKSEAKRILAGKSLVDGLRRSFVWAGLETDDGMRFPVRLSKDVRKVWRDAR